MFSNAKQNIPAQFVEIMRNQDEQRALKKKMFSEPKPTLKKDWQELLRLKKEMNEYRKNAERILKNNPGTGKSQG